MCEVNSAELWLRKKTQEEKCLGFFFTTPFYFEITWMVGFFQYT